LYVSKWKELFKGGITQIPLQIQLIIFM